jgi:hypothetical protein
MANLPATTHSETDLDPRQRFRENIADLLAEGWTIGRIASKMHPNDRRLAKNLRKRIRDMSYTDPKFAMEVAGRAKGQMLLDLNGTAAAVGARAKRGRVDAAKLLMESTGFHNPRIKHEHSGDIKLTLNIPRPSFDGSAQDVTDAEVVEE